MKTYVHTKQSKTGNDPSVYQLLKEQNMAYQYNETYHSAIKRNKVFSKHERDESKLSVVVRIRIQRKTGNCNGLSGCSNI